MKQMVIRKNKSDCTRFSTWTNPASATVAGFEAVTVKSNDQGLVDLEDLKE